jgi:hypothetical protein
VTVEAESKLGLAVKGVIEESPCDVILYAGPLDKPYDDDLLNECQEKKHTKVLLLLATYGGDANCAYRIARRLQKRYNAFSVYIHTICKSAGTLLALGAHEIIMSDYGEMGPLDVQLQKEDEIGVSTSGLAINQALTKLRGQAFDMFEEIFLQLRIYSGMQITTKSAGEIAANITIGLLSPIYGQVDPMRLGEIDRAVRIALEYGERLGKHNLREGALSKLVAEYPDHSFVIDRMEAEELFENVRKPTKAEMDLASSLQPIVDKALKSSSTIVLKLNDLTGESHERDQKGGEDPASKGPQDGPPESGVGEAASERSDQNAGESSTEEYNPNDGSTVVAG